MGSITGFVSIYLVMPGALCCTFQLMIRDSNAGLGSPELISGAGVDKIYNGLMKYRRRPVLRRFGRAFSWVGSGLSYAGPRWKS